MQKKITLHKIKLDVLLWALGGFAKAPSIRCRCGAGRLYDADDIEIIKYYYTHFLCSSRVRLKKDKVKELEERLNRPRGTIKVTVSQWRRSGRVDW